MRYTHGFDVREGKGQHCTAYTGMKPGVLICLIGICTEAMEMILDFQLRP